MAGQRQRGDENWANFCPSRCNRRNYQRLRPVKSYDSPTADEHRRAARRNVACAVLTVSDTRTLDDDRSGALAQELLEAAGHQVVCRGIVPDEPAQIELALQDLASRGEVEAALVTGGTGIAPRDQTPETVQGLLTKELPGFGELFRALSYQEIGPAAMLSRAVGGIMDRLVVLVVPGSPAAVRLAVDKLIAPELGHMVELMRR